MADADGPESDADESEPSQAPNQSPTIQGPVTITYNPFADDNLYQPSKKLLKHQLFLSGCIKDHMASHSSAVLSYDLIDGQKRNHKMLCYPFTLTCYGGDIPKLTHRDSSGIYVTYIDIHKKLYAALCNELLAAGHVLKTEERIVSCDMVKNTVSPATDSPADSTASPADSAIIIEYKSFTVVMHTFSIPIDYVYDNPFDIDEIKEYTLASDPTYLLNRDIKEILRLYRKVEFYHYKYKNAEADRYKLIRRDLFDEPKYCRRGRLFPDEYDRVSSDLLMAGYTMTEQPIRKRRNKFIQTWVKAKTR